MKGPIRNDRILFIKVLTALKVPNENDSPNIFSILVLIADSNAECQKVPETLSGEKEEKSIYSLDMNSKK